MLRGTVPLRVECAPAFNYARDAHTTSLVPDNTTPGDQKKALFTSESLSLDLRFFAESSPDADTIPVVDLKILDLQSKGHLGPGIYCDLNIMDGQVVTFVLRTPSQVESNPVVSKPSLEKAEKLGIPLDRVLSIHAAWKIAD